ncbi:hypothetical protein EJ05DRAFT_495789 [Pseudovirgaria hyperparasitica]|uniref:Alcohol acetyltransferase n=1 Tax=Pseudovirgaria hyperparasitica TaxID=470096 RepID=A0A6A6WLQ7_9PEZI|nr:uncharacterized protein EJ05DRAFT_495789 [Pseudovirgaria hyperparasitica]KAF2762939.1 hypothetical protein EJ05DRAFT_495789 [Pseudovirgaria hyperparasitica]
MASSEIVRSVGLLEKYSTARHDLGFYTNVIVGAEYVLPQSYQLPLQHHIYRACATIIAEHANLSVEILNGRTATPVFARLTQVALEECVIFESTTTTVNYHGMTDQQLREILEKQHNQDFPDHGPLWRLLIASDTAVPRNFTAFFVFHHAIGDGTSGLAFHRELLAALLDSKHHSKGSVVQTVLTSPKKPLLSAVEDFLPLSISWIYLLGVILEGLLWKKFEKGFWYGGVIQKPLETTVRTTGLSKSSSEAFRSLCKENGTTVTAALQTLVAEVILEIMPANYTNIRSNGAMSLRSFIPDVTQRSFGVWVTAWNEVYQKSELSTEGMSWKRARASRKAIEDAVAARGNNSAVGLLRYVPDYQKYLLNKLGSQRDATFEVSNLGAYKDDARSHDHHLGGEDPHIERITFSQSGNVAGPALAVGAVTGGDGCLSLAFSWQKGVLAEDFVVDVMEKTRTRFYALVRVPSQESDPSTVECNSEDLYDD